MGYLEITPIHEAQWIYWHGVDDMYAWQEMNGLPRDKVMLNSGTITVELFDQEMMLYCEVIPLQADGKPYKEADGSMMIRTVSMPYKEPVPEGIGHLVDWDFGLPEKPKRVALDDAA